MSEAIQVPAAVFGKAGSLDPEAPKTTGAAG